MKKILALLLAMMMLLSFAACGGNDTPTPSGSGDNTPSNSEQQEQPGNSDDGDDESGGNVNSEKKPYGEDMKSEVGLSLEEMQPDTFDESKVNFYLWSGWAIEFDSGNGANEEYILAYLKKLYDITASVSDGGTNYKPTADVTNPAKPPEELVPAGTFDEEITSWDYGAVWYYKYNDEVVIVNVSYYINSRNWFTIKIDNLSR